MSDITPKKTAGMVGGGLNMGTKGMEGEVGKRPSLMLEISQFQVKDATGQRGLHTCPGQVTIYCQNPTKPLWKPITGAPQKSLWEKKNKNLSI